VPKFLNQPEAYRLLQRENPPNVYPDGGPADFLSTAENDSVAKTVASVYANMERAWINLFVQLTEESIGEWEVAVFGRTISGGLTLQERRDRLLGKIRALPTISLWDVLVLVNSYVPDGVYVGIVENGSVGAGSPSFPVWSLGVSLLGVNTFLGGISISRLTGPSAGAVFGPEWPFPLTDGTYLDPTLTEEGALQIRAQQYSYTVKIYGYTLPADVLAALELALAEAEPARSNHNIVQNASLASDGLTQDVDDVDRYDLINVIARDSNSPSGYVGKVVQ
jgi:hypothetical protein